MQLRANRDDLNIYLTGNEVIGVVISNKQSLHQERGWNTFQCLNELISTNSNRSGSNSSSSSSSNGSSSSSSNSSIQGFNIFPLPIGIYRDPIKLSITFAYELINKHEIIQFHEIIINPILSIYLRQKPIIIQIWCQQLYNIYHKLLLCTTGSLMKPINIISDINIRDNGLLLFSNISFDNILPKNKIYYKNEILFMICDLLSSVLCISRIVKTSLHYLR